MQWIDSNNLTRVERRSEDDLLLAGGRDYEDLQSQKPPLGRE